MSCGKKYYRVAKDGSLVSAESPLAVVVGQDDDGQEEQAGTYCHPEQSEGSFRKRTPGFFNSRRKIDSRTGQQTRPSISPDGRFDVKSATPAQKELWVHRTFQSISAKYDLMNDLESFGLHRYWKRTLVRAVNALAPRDVLDVASGTGDIALAIAGANPQARVIALDFSQNMLDVARSRAESLLIAGSADEGIPESATSPGIAPATELFPINLPRLEFVQASALDLPFDDSSFDVATISFGLRNMSDYRQVIVEMERVLRPGGYFFCLEASYPTIPVIKQLFRLYFRFVMPAIATLVTGKRTEYLWLNDSTEAFLTKEQLTELMEQCGLSNAGYRSFALGAAALHYGVKL